MPALPVDQPQFFDTASPSRMLPPVHTLNALPGPRRYRIKIGPGLLARLGQECAELKLGRRCAIVSDTNVQPRYGDVAKRALAKAGFESVVLTVPAGERAKSLKTVEACYNKLAA